MGRGVAVVLRELSGVWGRKKVGNPDIPELGHSERRETSGVSPVG